MRFGSTSLQLTGILAKTLHRPKLRPDLKVSEQVISGETSYMLKVPETQAFCRFGAYEYQLLSLCDGTRTPAEIAQAMSDLDPDQAPSEQEVLDWLDSIDPSLWEGSRGEQSLAVLERIREERSRRIDRASLFYIRFAAWDPNRVLGRLYPYLRWIYTRTFAAISILLFAATAFIVASDYARIRQDTVQFYSFTNKTAYDLWIF